MLTTISAEERAEREVAQQRSVGPVSMRCSRDPLLLLLPIVSWTPRVGRGVTPFAPCGIRLKRVFRFSTQGARAGLAERPYENWSGESRGIVAPPLLGSSREVLLPAVQPGPEGLSDDDVRGFCARGFIVVAPKKSAEFHEANFEKFQQSGGSYVGSNQGYFGLGMEGLKAVYDDEAVQSTLRSLLGPGCVMHNHHGTHRNGPGATNQSWVCPVLPIRKELRCRPCNDAR